MKAHLKKLPGGTLVPDDDETAQYLTRVKVGSVVAAEITQPRNYLYHKKFFALLNVGFDAWEPEQEHKGQVIEKNFERFRKDVTILAGYHHAVPTLAGGFRLEADSISFARMDQETFEKLYSATINVLLQRVLTNYTRDDIERVIEEVLRFDR